MRLSAGDPGVDEHQFLSECLEWGATYDMMNLGELLVFEHIARRYQLWEEVYASALREAESGEQGTDWLDERRLFLGTGRSHGSALVSPELEEHVSGELQKESAVLKEKRKGREERALARGSPLAVPGGSSGAGEGAAAGGPPRGRGRGRQ